LTPKLCHNCEFQEDYYDPIFPAMLVEEAPYQDVEENIGIFSMPADSFSISVSVNGGSFEDLKILSGLSVI